MNKRGSYGSMAERVARSGQHAASPAPGVPAALDVPAAPDVKHCWVSDGHGQLPALLLEWRRRGGGWHGRVVRLVLDEGTWVVDAYDKETGVEEPIITGVAGDLNEAKITVVGVPDVPGKAADIFTIVAKTGANIDMIVQNVSAAATGLTDISFTLPKAEGEKVLTALRAEQGEVTRRMQ